MRHFSFVLATLLISGCTPPSPNSAQNDVTVFLVRHAERADDGPVGGMSAENPMMAQDPPLSPAGRDRARLLAQMLRDAGLTHLHSTDTRRTRETVEPLAQATGLSVEMYGGSDLEALARRLARTPGRHLVVGHSDTTPELVRFLGGDPGPPIEEMEYDRLYVVNLGTREVQTLLLRFGQGFTGF